MLAQEILFYILRLTIRPELDNLISAKTRLSTLYLGIRKTTNIATVSRKAPRQRCENELNKPYLNIFIGGLWEYNIQQLHYCDLFSLVWNLWNQLCQRCHYVSLCVTGASQRDGTEIQSLGSDKSGLSSQSEVRYGPVQPMRGGHCGY